MSKAGKGLISDPQALENKLKEIVRIIHDDADPHLMNVYRRFFKRNVSIFSRNYVIAYLIKQLDDGVIPLEVRSPIEARQGDSTAEPSDNEFSDMRTLFVSVGKNRRIYPRDISTLITENTEVPADQIGPIKILDNYSFVEVSPTVSDAVIAAVNGREIRGRKITVNYARKRP